MRFDQDLVETKREVVNVFDVIFGPEVENFCQKSVQFRDMIFRVALESVQKVSDAKKETISKDFSLMRFPCKGEKPSLLLYRNQPNE